MHEEWEDLIPFYVTHTLPAHEAAALTNHLATCAGCQKALEDWRNIAGATQAAADEWSRDLPPLSASLRARIAANTPANVITMPTPPPLYSNGRSAYAPAPLSAPPPPPAERLPMRTTRRQNFSVVQVAAVSAIAVFLLGAILLVGLRGFLSPSPDNTPTQQVAMGWQTNTPRPEATLVSTTTSEPLFTHSGGALVQGNSPTETFTPLPPTPTETPRPTNTPESVSLSTDESNMTRFGVDETPATLMAQDATVVLFTVSPNTVQPGQMVILSWEVSGASRVQLVADFDDDGTYEFSQDNLPDIGSTAVIMPMTDDSLESFQLWVYGEDPIIPASQTSVSVAIQCPYTHFFFGNNCPTGIETIFTATAQRYQNGIIILRDGSSEGLVLFDDGTVGTPNLVDSPSAFPPDGLSAPSPEFAPYYRLALGWATDAPVTYQMTTRGAVFNPALDEQPIWLTLPNGRTIQINSSNGNLTDWKRVR